MFLRITAAFVIALFSLTLSSLAENWPQFRGPQGDGHSSATGLPVTWSETENIKWKTEIDGKAWSSPVVWDDQIWMTNAPVDGKQMFAVCVDAKTGKVLHNILVFENEKPRYCHPTNSYASSTPVIERGRLYVHFGSYGTACLNTLSGRILWSRRDLPCNHYRGPASSPVLHNDLLFANFDGIDVQYVVAFDKKTGETVWKKDRDIDYGTDNGDRKKAYGTPTIVTFAGRTQLVSPAAVATLAYDPKTGDVLWRVRHGGMNVAARPFFANGKVYIHGGPGGLELFAVRPDGNGDVTKSHVEWTYRKGVPKRASVLLVDDLIYMGHDSGVITCLEAKTGTLVWQERTKGGFWASPIFADGRIYFSTQGGAFPVLAPGRKFKLLAQNNLEDGCNASPAVYKNSLIVRTKSALYRIGR